MTAGKPALSRWMTAQEFGNGYWYAGPVPIAHPTPCRSAHPTRNRPPTRGRAAHIRSTPRRQTSQAYRRLVVGFRGLVMGL